MVRGVGAKSNHAYLNGYAYPYIYANGHHYN